MCKQAMSGGDEDLERVFRLTYSFLREALKKRMLMAQKNLITVKIEQEQVRVTLEL
jgi:hypothetical protein